MYGELPQFLLFTEVTPAGADGDGGYWHFVLQQTGGPERIEAGDGESGMGGERLQLLAVVRGLEALDRPSQVTLVTSSRYIGRGIRTGLAEWKESNWRWERFGEMAPVKNCDLWKRIDRAMQIHRVECRIRLPESIPFRSSQPFGPASPTRRTSIVGRAVRQWTGAVAGGVSRLARAGYAANL